MTRQNSSLLIILGAVVIGAGLFLLAQRQSADANQPPITAAQAKRLKKDGSCRIADGSIRLNKQQADSLTMAVIKHIKDVPQGTHTHMNLSRFDAGSEVQGSVVYESGYGAYNFTLRPNMDRGRQPQPAQGRGGQAQDQEWSVSEFVACTE